MDLDALAVAVAPTGPGRVIVGISGPPGGGKTTLARALCAATGYAHAPGDGFIIAESYTDAEGVVHERGAVSGFDTAAYARLVADLANAHGQHDVTVPNYRHTQDGDGEDAFVVLAGAPGVVTECNFLGSPTHRWPDVRAGLTTLVFLEAPWEVCRPRLLDRQLAKGIPLAEASARVDTHDHANYLEVVTHGRSTADRVVTGHISQAPTGANPD